MKSPGTPFFRKSMIFSAAFILTFASLECISFFVLVIINPNQGEKPKFSRELSGYTIFRNTPDFIDFTTKENADEKDIKTDQYGFMCDEEITPHKDSGVVRIFLMGGSAARSAGQTQTGDCYNAVKEFPRFNYNYNISIAGYLKKYLCSKFPAKRIQVINGACYEWCLHQSMIAYLENVNTFNPDIVINMDGFNDVGAICTGAVYEMSESYSLGRFADLRNTNESFLFRSKTVQLVYYLFMRLTDPAARKTGKTTAYINQHTLMMASIIPGYEAAKKCACGVDTIAYNYSKYITIKPVLVKHSATWLNVLSKYANIIKDDSVKFAFIMQPILQRSVNKPLADYEREMQQIDVFKSNNPARVLGKSIGFGIGTDVPFDFTEVNRLGPRDDITYLTKKYFFDDYLSEAVKTMAAQKGFAYCDMNYEIQGLNKDFPFYTDYCHLTKQGYQYTGERIGRLIIEQGWIK